MYKKHKLIIVITFVAISILVYLMKVDYFSISSESVNIISIALAVYLAAYAGLQGENVLAQKLRKTKDTKLPTQTQLGVFNNYIKSSLVLGLITIITSCIIIVVNNKYLSNTTVNVAIPDWYYIMSSFAFGLFAQNFVVIWFVGKFIINRISWNK